MVPGYQGSTDWYQGADRTGLLRHFQNSILRYINPEQSGPVLARAVPLTLILRRLMSLTSVHHHMTRFSKSLEIEKEIEILTAKPFQDKDHKEFSKTPEFNDFKYI